MLFDELVDEMLTNVGFKVFNNCSCVCLLDRSIETEIPGSWFGGTEMSSLTATERVVKYKAQAVEYADVREFPGPSSQVNSPRSTLLQRSLPSTGLRRWVAL
jgi:hypothetical protein